MSRASATASAHSGPVTCHVPRPIRGTGVPWTRQVYGVLGDVPELLGLGEALKLLEGLVLDLADALPRDVERAPDLVERARVLAAEPVAQLEDAALAVGEVLQRLAQRLLGEDLRRALVGRLGALVGDELAELGLLLVADGLLEADRRLGAALDRVDLLGIDPGDVGDLLGGGLAAELGDELALGAADLVELLDDVDGDADRARLVGQRAGDRLADPPRRVGRELEALAVVELLRRAHQAKRALLDEVEEGQALVAVVLGDRDNQAQVGLDHLLLRIEVAALDALGEVDLLLRGQQPHLPDVLQEELERVGRHVRPQVQRGLDLRAAAALVGRALDVGRGGRRVDLLDELDLGLLEVAAQLLHVRFVEVQLGDGGGDLVVGEHAERLAPRDQGLDLFELLQFRDGHAQYLFLILGVAFRETDESISKFRLHPSPTVSAAWPLSDTACVGVRHDARMADEIKGPDVLSSLPRSRPQRRSAKRDAPAKRATTKAAKPAARKPAARQPAGAEPAGEKPAAPPKASAAKAPPKPKPKSRVKGSPRPSAATTRAREDA